VSDGVLTLAESPRLADEVYERLRRSILEGGLGAGARLSVPGLASRLGVSRSPVREAVLRLVNEGLAQESPRKGVVVARLGLAELRSVYEVRAVLEGLAARLAAPTLDEHVLAELGELFAAHQRAADAGDLEASLEVDLAFHAKIRSAAHNPQLEVFLEQIQGKIRLAMATTLVHPGPRLAVEDHRRILEALERRDPEAAELAAKAHVQRLTASLVTSMRRFPVAAP
jgi:DNA-binding GntR family transcriptional regulator